jgi:hypothetical protein
MNISRPSSLRVGLLLVVTVLAVACGDGGAPGAGSTTQSPESDLPEPPAGKATVGGTVSVDGQPVSGEGISLLRQDGDEAKTEIDTGADGTFVFEGVEPGTYALVTAVVVEEAEMATGGFGLEWDSPCQAPGYAVLNTAVSNKATGESAGVIATASNEGGEGRDDKPFDVAAGDRITQDVTFECETAA